MADRSTAAEAVRRYDERRAAEQYLCGELFDDDPGLDAQHYMRRRGRWRPIEDGPSIDTYEGETR